MAEESFQERSKRIEQKMKLIQDRTESNLDSVIFPWWYSGSACIAALMWLSFLAILFLRALGYIEKTTEGSLNMLLVIILAIIFSAMASGSRK